MGKEFYRFQLVLVQYPQPLDRFGGDRVRVQGCLHRFLLHFERSHQLHRTSGAVEAGRGHEFNFGIEPDMYVSGYLGE